MTTKFFADSDHPSIEERLLSALGPLQNQPLSSVSHQNTPVVTSADYTGQLKSNLRHQSPSTIHQAERELATRGQHTATHTTGGDGSLATASLALSAPRLTVQEALGLKLILPSPTMPRQSSDVVHFAGWPSKPSDHGEEVEEADIPMSPQGPNVELLSSVRSTHNTNGSLEGAGQKAAVKLPGQKCLRRTRAHNPLKVLIMKHIEDPEATDPDDLAMVLAHDLLPFYKVWARSPEPPAEDQHIPTLVDLQMIVIPILKDKSMSDYKSTPDEKSKLQHIKCMTILREVDDCYGGKGWAGPLPTSNTDHDSGIVPDMFQSDQSSQSKSIPSGPDTALVPRGKRPRDPTISTTKPAKRPRSESVWGQAALQPHMISSNMSPDRTEDPSLQSLSQGRSEMPSNIPTPSVTQTSQTPDDYETILRPETRRVLQELLVAEVEEIHARLAMTEAERVEINNQQATLVQADASLSRRKPKKRRTRCLLKKHCKEGMKACDGDTKDELGMMQHIERSHFPPNIFICPVCYHKSIRKDSFISHFDKRHGESYDNEAKRDKLKKRVIIKEIDDTYCDICPLCMEKVELNSRKEFMTHIKEHVEGKLDNYPYTDRCSSKTNHNWKKSSCIPEEYRQEIEGRKKRRKSCRPSDQDFHDDQEDDDSDDEEDPSDPPPPRDRSSQGPSGQNGGRASGRAITYFSSGNDGRPYASPYRSEMATMPSSFARMPGNSNSSLHINSQRTNPRTTIPGINLIKRCFKSIRNLGRGGFGAVDEVVCKSTDQSYARKIIPLSQTSTRVSTEVEILKQLRHQNIIHLAAHCTTPDQQLWLFTTPVAKANLATYLRADIKCRALPDRELLPSWEGDLASALKYIHGRGIIHGDIKPQNILVSSDMKIYLADFGSARAKDAQQSHGTEAKPVLALTPKYSAPEVSYYKSVGYSWETGAAADVFSLGGVWAEIETVYTGLSIHAFETFRSSGSVYNSFQANLPRTYLWLDFLWVLQESVLQTSRCWTHAPNTLQTAKDMLSFDPHQRPNADQLTTVLHCTCNVDSPVQPTSDLACYSDPLNKEYPYYWPNEPLPANNINMILRSKLSSYWNPITEGFSPDGRIDISYNWDRDMPTQTLSPWLEDCTDSAAPVFFRSKLDVRKSTSDISKNLRMSDVDQTDSFPILLGKSSLQKHHAIAVHEARSPFEARPMHGQAVTSIEQRYSLLAARVQASEKIKRGFKNIANGYSTLARANTESERNIMSLEFAKTHGLQVQSFSDYLQNTPPPSSVEDKLKFWESVNTLVIFGQFFGQLPEKSYHSRHGDLKPENILILRSKTESPYVCCWKISDFGISSLEKKKVLKDDDNLHDLQDTDKTRTYGPPSTERPSWEEGNLDMWSMGCILAQVGAWATHGWQGIESHRSKWNSGSAPRTEFDVEPDGYEPSLKERAWNAKRGLLKTLAAEPDSLTKSIAEDVIAPMLEPPDKQPSWKWICDKAQTLLNDARGALNDYKKTMTKATTPLLSLVRSKIKSTCISSTLAKDGSRSDQTGISDSSLKYNTDRSGFVDDECHKITDIDPNIFTDPGGHYYMLERYLRDKSDCRYLFPARGCNALKRLHRVYLGDAIERFERVFIDAR